jgi:arabinose-5-phosphate isomerase
LKNHIQQIFDREAKAIRKLIASGMGKAGQVANNIATTFSSTGTPAVFLHPSDAQHGDLGIIQKNDVLLLVSNSGKTREIIELFSLSRILHPTIPVIVLTGNAKSALGEVADLVLETGNPDEVCPLGLTPTTSTTVMTVIGDALVVLMMEKINFTSAEYAKRHHGGYLGHKSRISEHNNY